MLMPRAWAAPAPVAATPGVSSTVSRTLRWTGSSSTKLVSYVVAACGVVEMVS